MLSATIWWGRMVEGEKGLLRRLSRAYERAQRRRVVEEGISVSACHLLMNLGEAGGMSQGLLTQRLGFEKSWVSRALDRTVDSGLVERHRDGGDGRVCQLALSAAGQERFRALSELLAGLDTAVLSRLNGRDRDDLLRILPRVIRVLEEECSPVIRELDGASASEVQGVRAMLGAAGLPLEGHDDWLGNCLVAVHGGQVVGSGCFEHYGPHALVRSVVVHPDHRGRGLGNGMWHALAGLMAGRGVREAWLLSMGTTDYWEAQGFRTVPRGAAPSGIAGSAEFVGACPASAVLMTRDVGT